MSRQNPGAEAAHEVTRELTDLIADAASDDAASDIEAARDAIKDRAGDDLITGFSTAETRVERAVQNCECDDLAVELRQVRQALVGLTDGGQGVVR